jgi:deoxyribose-phosphate aldolase
MQPTRLNGRVLIVAGSGIDQNRLVATPEHEIIHRNRDAALCRLACVGNRTRSGLRTRGNAAIHHLPLLRCHRHPDGNDRSDGWLALDVACGIGTTAAFGSVVGFPHGTDRPEAKARAASLAAADGATEIDMVQNFGALKSSRATMVAADIEAVVRAVPGIPVKVILETAALTDEEKREACRLALSAGAAFVKTSTGFHPAGGATVAYVRLLRAAVGPGIGVKASGGIRSLADALAMHDAGANRIGTSGSAAILKALEAS